jgi:hypothetical protein
MGKIPKEVGDMIMVTKKQIKTETQARTFITKLKSRVAKDNAIRWFIKNKGWYL